MRERSFHQFVERLSSNRLLDEVEFRARSNFVSLTELYEGPSRAPSIVAARRSVYTWLSKKGKGVNEIARLFDRAPSGVSVLLRVPATKKKRLKK